MAICFYGDGTILLKKKNAKEFVDKFIELAKRIKLMIKLHIKKMFY